MINPLNNDKMDITNNENDYSAWDIVNISGMHTLEHDIRTLLRCCDSTKKEGRTNIIKYRFIATVSIVGIEEFKNRWKEFLSNIVIVAALILSASISFLLSPPGITGDVEVGYFIFISLAIGCHFSTILGCSYALTVLNLAIRHSDILRAFNSYGNLIDASINLTFIIGIFAFIIGILLAVSSQINNSTLGISIFLFLCPPIIFGILPGLKFWGSSNFVPYWINSGYLVNDPVLLHKALHKMLQLCEKSLKLASTSIHLDPLTRVN